jgi:hypothetical protein
MRDAGLPWRREARCSSEVEEQARNGGVGKRKGLGEERMTGWGGLGFDRAHRIRVRGPVPVR